MCFELSQKGRATQVPETSMSGISKIADDHAVQMLPLEWIKTTNPLPNYRHATHLAKSVRETTKEKIGLGGTASLI